MVNINQFNEKIWLNKWLDANNKIKIPDYCNKIKIDVGLAGDACNSAIWLSETNDRFVIGIEPVDYHWQHLTTLGAPDNINIEHPKWAIVQLDEYAVKLNRKKITDIKDRFMPLKIAIDNVLIPGETEFYLNKKELGETGSSSLKYWPNRSHLIDKKIQVDVCSLEFILDYLPWERFEFIEHIKTDCEGLDFDVIKSIGKYLKKIVFITCECVAAYCSAEQRIEIVKFMRMNNFSIVSFDDGNIGFVNDSLINEIERFKLNNKTLGL